MTFSLSITAEPDWIVVLATIVVGMAATVACVIRAEEKWTFFVALICASIGTLLGLSYFLGRSSDTENETEETEDKSRPKTSDATSSRNGNGLSTEEQPSQKTSIVSSQTVPPPSIPGDCTPVAYSKSGSPVNNSSTTAPSGMTATNEIDNNWRCACEGGFLPPGLLKTFGGAEAVFRMSTGQCYHKQ